MSTHQGKYIWLLGASSGIGAALAQELAQQGAILALSSRNAEKLEALQDSLTGQGHIVVPIDAGDVQSVADGFEKITQAFPKIDRAIFMAAIYSAHDGQQKDLNFVHEMLRVNLGGAFNMMHSLIPYLKKQGFGQIALCASVAGYRGLPLGQPYCAGKAGLISLAESSRIELAPHNIDIKVINPGFVKTPLTDKNNFPMPFMIEVQKAASTIAQGLLKTKFEIHFPKRMTWIMKTLRIMPSALYFKIAKFLYTKAR